MLEPPVGPVSLVGDRCSLLSLLALAQINECSLVDTAVSRSVGPRLRPHSCKPGGTRRQVGTAKVTLAHHGVEETTSDPWIVRLANVAEPRAKQSSTAEAGDQQHR